MTNAAKYAVPTLSVLSAVVLAILVPGGPIETRNFARIEPVILGAFNTFLTALGIVSLFLAYFTYRACRWAFAAAAASGLGYFLVYVLDLFHIFPVSPDPMSPALWAIELAGTTLSVPLMVLAVTSASRTTTLNEEHDSAVAKLNIWLGVPVVLVALSIIIFATYSAMHG